jgi:hypothetical protein
MDDDGEYAWPAPEVIPEQADCCGIGFIDSPKVVNRILPDISPLIRLNLAYCEVAST